jgi:hypothetical protein
MTPIRRWLLVALAVALVIGVPVLVRRLPVGASDLSAADVLSRIRAAGDRGYSGTVELSGDVALPVTSHFTDIGELLGGETTLRVWWHDASAWRVDKVLVTGETDLFHRGDQTTTWKYESLKATTSTDPTIRLPRTSDLLPPALAARVLEGARADMVSRLPTRRVAGVAAVGLRIRRAASQSSIDHVDLWAEPGTGTVLRLDAFSTPRGTASFSTVFTSFSATPPSLAVTRFDPPPLVPDRFERVLDIADAANQYAPVIPPRVVAGLRRSGSTVGAVGIYGTGLTQILAIPLRRDDAGILRDQLMRSVGVVESAQGPTLMAGPLGVLVTGEHKFGWILVGTVTRATLITAATDLEKGTRFR